MTSPSPVAGELQNEHLELDDRAVNRSKSRLLRSRALWVLAFDLALIAFFSITSTEHVFFSIQNAQSVMIGTTEALLLALGLAMLLGAGMFDVSLGANLVLSSVVGALVIDQFQGADRTYTAPWTAIGLGFLACVSSGITFGLINGLLIGVGDINSLIATLATLGIGTGVALLLADGADIGGMPFQMQESIGLKTVAGIPLPAIFAVLAAASLWGVVRYTRFGMHTQAVGSSRPAAERAGLRVRTHYIRLAVLAGALAGVTGFIDLSRFGSTALNGHSNDSLGAVTAVVIGGTLLQGGFISIPGAVCGAAMSVILQSGLVIAGVPSFWQLIVVGLVLILAVLVDRISSKQRASAR
jgi:ribose transport system permease protein